ncbi:MAG: Zn-ribbon domain-containing OB-fold protein [Candidatus Diapherotrites archaeon]
MQKAVPMHWRKNKERYRIEGILDEETGKEYYPKRIINEEGKEIKPKTKEMPHEGKIISYTEVFVGPAGFENETPYYLAIIELENGIRLISQIVDSEKEKIKIGAKVKKVFRKIHDNNKEEMIVYGYKFKVVE